jgi:hypothetical protein
MRLPGWIEHRDRAIAFSITPLKNAIRTFCPAVAQPDQDFGHGSRLVQAVRDRNAVHPGAVKSLGFQHLNGGRGWDRTSDPYDVNVVLLPVAQRVSVSTSTLWERVLKASHIAGKSSLPGGQSDKKPRNDIGLGGKS